MGQVAKSTEGLIIQSSNVDRDEIVTFADALRRARALRDKRTDRDRATITVADQKMTVPRSVMEVLEGVTTRLAAGDDVAVLSTQEELTTGEAAKLLNVSRQYLVRLCDEEKLSCRKEGTHRRLSLTDVLAFREQRDKERTVKFRQLITDSFEEGEYDEPVPWRGQ